ncbi:protein kinase C delta type-like [Xenopus laevis]|uniref:Protein kinase C delta type-like n=1 Tax=Xenopus laevis TaxID=8355 RepID=A0A8J1LWW3_XENLA|nr:protein kinase C delta type-like [Xenopus laevis]
MMECESKQNLFQMIREKGKLNMETIIFYAAELVVGIQFLHSKGIVHRDLKASNILITKDGHMKIVDFGQAEENVFEGKKIQRISGTLSHMAPEVRNVVVL